MMDELIESLKDAADAFDQVTQWMDDIALPVLNVDDSADGGNSLCEGLKMKAWEIRELLKKQSKVAKR